MAFPTLSYKPMGFTWSHNETGVCYQVQAQLHDLVKVVLDILGIDGRYALSGSGNNQIVGDPDFSWLRNPTKHPKIVVRCHWSL